MELESVRNENAEALEEYQQEINNLESYVKQLENKSK